MFNFELLVRINLMEIPLPKEPVVGGGKTPAGNTGDPVHLIEQPPLAPSNIDRGISQ
jgi:hypothetical protein